MTPKVCKVCGQPLTVEHQSALYPGGRDHTLITCWHSGCTLYSYTFDSADYDDVDPRAYAKEATR